jgi:soluble lytic murein transglycosylase-like protein
MKLLTARLAVCFGLLFILNQPGAALSQGSPGGPLARLFVIAQERTGVPSTLLAAVALQESAMKPWSVNIAGEGLHLNSKQSALARVRNASKKSFDLGLMQINSLWMRRLNIPPHKMINPKTNVIVGSLILRDCIDKYGIRGGVSCYHSGEPNNQDGKIYAQKVFRNFIRLR